MKLLFCAFGALIPLFTLAAIQQASIITRPGVATPPIKYYFDLSSALSEGVNHAVKATISASNAEKTAVRFESVQLFGQDGVVMGNNVALKTDALTATPYGFVFQNFGVTPAELLNVAGIEIKFMDLGGENSTGKVTVQSVAISVIRNRGDACILEDPIIMVVPPPPPPTILSIQRARPLVQPGTHGTGDSESSGGVASSQGPNSPGTMASDDSTGVISWSSPGNAQASDNLYASVTAGFPSSSFYLKATNFLFAIPAGATIDGITVEVERAKQLNGTILDSRANIIKGGTIGSTNKAIQMVWSATEAYVTYGSASGSDGKWGETWQASDINATTFGFSLVVVTEGLISVIGVVDHIRITVNYTTAPGSSVYDTFGELVRAFARRVACSIAPSAACKNN